MALVATRLGHWPGIPELEMKAQPDEPFLGFVLDQLLSFGAEMGASAAEAALEGLGHLLSRVGSRSNARWLLSHYHIKRMDSKMARKGALLTNDASDGSLLGKAWASLGRKGPLGLGQDVRDYLRWRLARPVAAPHPDAPTPQSNWDLNQAELQTRPDVLRSKPVLVYAESTSRCNLHCFMCRLSFPETTRQAREHMKLETFARLEPLLEPESRLSLFGLGEPLLNPNFVEMLRIAKARGSFVGLNSNAMLLTERIAQAMVELGQDLLVVSFSGGTRETYERVITGANYERVLGNLRRLNELKQLSAISYQPSAISTQDAGLDTGDSSLIIPIEQVKPVLQLQFTAMRDNVHEVPEVVRLALELRCAGVVVMPLTIVDPSLAEQSLLDPALWPQVEKAFAEARRVADGASYSFDLQLPTAELLRAMKARQDGGSSPSTHHSSLICYEPWQTLYARDDGTVNTCCYSNRVLGDLKQQTALEIWNGELYRRFRARMRSNNKPSECRVCHKLRGDDWYDQRVDEGAFYDEL
ncbi:MAG: radical SAM protein [Chloroflexota bacterium]